MTRRRVLGILAVLGALGGTGYFLAAAPPSAPFDTAARADRPPRLRPDYGGIVFPPNIAPLNFIVGEPGDAFDVCFTTDSADPVHVRSRSPSIIIPPAEWRRLLRTPGRDLAIDVCVRSAEGQWTRFQTLTSHIAEEPIDRYLVYRRLRPMYSKYAVMGIFQRDLEGDAETPILRNSTFDGGCVHCHSFAPGDPSHLVLHVRGPHGMAAIIAHDGKVERKDLKTPFGSSPAAFSSWHPGGRILAFSVNKFIMQYHSVGEVRDIFDSGSAVAIYRLDDDRVTSTDALRQPDRNVSWPAWSADGKYLYYCDGPRLTKERYREALYDLKRIAYDAAADAWGKPETVLAARDTGLSILEPRPSPDGRWLLFLMCDYGSLPVYAASSDLYLLDLGTGRYTKMALNTNRAETYHGWSTNSRWIVFSSKRDDGVFQRPYFAYLDASGQDHKPFLLPQADPTFYDDHITMFTVPELLRSPVTVTERELAAAITGLAPENTPRPSFDPRIVPHGPDASPQGPYAAPESSYEDAHGN